MIKNSGKSGALFFVVLLLSGCATPMQYVPSIDYNVNKGNCPTDKACIYVFRPASYFGGALHFEISDNNSVIGMTGPGSYLAWQREPGQVNLQSKAENTDNYNFTAEAGQNYYVLQTVEMGILSARSIIRPISKEEAEGYLNSCHPAGKSN